jgi:hypothetical protein
MDFAHVLAVWIKPFVSYVKDEYKRSIVCKYLDMFENSVGIDESSI